MIIAYHKLSAEALQALIEDFDRIGHHPVRVDPVSPLEVGNDLGLVTVCL